MMWCSMGIRCRPGNGRHHIGSLSGRKVEKVDPLTVRVRFTKPTPFWSRRFVGPVGMIMPRHLFEPLKAPIHAKPGKPEPVEPVPIGSSTSNRAT